jgi:hypothetical protein
MPCPCCRQFSAPTPANVLGPLLYTFMYAVLFNCQCGSTRAVVLWESADV